MSLTFFHTFQEQFYWWNEKILNVFMKCLMSIESVVMTPVWYYLYSGQSHANYFNDRCILASTNTSYTKHVIYGQRFKKQSKKLELP